jgi:leukotriene-A4 hydrolase
MWGTYKIVLLPPSFPFGGMENPLLTFASPSIVVGDKSGVAVAIHEIAHSWTGNSITCINWSNIWINEGMTRFLERKTLSILPEFGQEWANIDAINGNTGLLNVIKDFGETNSFSSLLPDTRGINPDDSFSTVPYEKGFLMLYIFEMDYFSDIGPMLKDLVSNFRYQSIDETDVKKYFKEFKIFLVFLFLGYNKIWLIKLI